ncbi:helix-turn-helix domain-containing protein [Sinomonas sp. G460-2]|uniref:helix-turn-helix domain-containing protein n=1 Tax=Sinomonas sp. G460-2 TaxID=3393464 RepID=UPI0039EFB179
MDSIGARVSALIPEDRTQKSVASEIGMAPDAFSRALRGERGFAAIELAKLADLLDADLHYLITGEPDPARAVFVARHDYDPATGRRTVPGADGDRQGLSYVDLAYRQADLTGLAPSIIPSSVEDARERLGGVDFVRPFIDRLEALGIDVVRLPGLSTAYSLLRFGRAVIVIQGSGNWFRENWSLAHELGHLVLGHSDPGPDTAVKDQNERNANAFAAELLLPAERMRSLDWLTVAPAELAGRVWDFGVSTDALAKRLNSLRITASPVVGEWASETTQKLLRRHWVPTEDGDPITRRMDAASARRFPLALQDAHLSLIAQGRVRKDTLAWMLGVEADSLEVDEPAPKPTMSADELSAALGL